MFWCCCRRGKGKNLFVLASVLGGRVCFFFSCGGLFCGGGGGGGGGGEGWGCLGWGCVFFLVEFEEILK